MVTYLLLFISVAFFLTGIGFGMPNNIITKSKRIIISVIASCFLGYSIIFIASDYITGNGVDYPIVYFLRDTFIGLNLTQSFFYFLPITLIGTAIFLGILYTINKIASKAGSKRRKPGRYGLIFYLFALIAFISSPTTYGYLLNFYFSKSIEMRRIAHAEGNRYDTNRFIAHAGGKIEGSTYTNSLEALDLSYKNGFRLFELDILESADSVFVAAHSWEDWQNLTGYNGQLPPSSSIFKQYKILDKYTPLDINDINNWFSGHPDAILVTDKVNSPFRFSKSFIAKERLIMELFSLEAVKEGVESNIKSAMASWGVLSEIKGDKVQKLLDLGVTDIAASRRLIKYNIPLMTRLKNNGVKVYVFHVNYDKGKDEDYVVRFDMDYIYGLYADEFDFEGELDCGKNP